MKFNSYQTIAATFGVYSNAIEALNCGPAASAMLNLLYPTVGLADEAGEVAGKVKKLLRDGTSYEATKEALISELGDVLWYISQLATVLGVSLEEVAQTNLNKLTSRQQRNVLHGNGDHR